MIKSEVKLWLHSGVLLKVTFSHTQTESELFLLSCSHIFFSLSEPRGIQLLSSQRAQRKLSQATNCLAGCCICLAECRADEVTEQMLVLCVHVCVRVNTVSLDGSINIECTIIVAEPLLETVSYCMNEEVNSLYSDLIGHREYSKNLIGRTIS